MMKYHDIFSRNILITIRIESFTYNFTQWWIAKNQDVKRKHGILFEASGLE